MNKESLLKRQSSLKDQFNIEQSKVREHQEESLRIQGEYRAITALLEDFKEDQTPDDANTIDVESTLQESEDGKS